MRAYGDRGSASGYEYDHFVPLELGGATNDPRNLWPEAGATPNPKDAVENELNEKVCDGTMALASAQRAIVGNWVSLTHRSSAPSTRGAHCLARADYNIHYSDYDVYVESNQPDRDARVTGDGKTASYYTNSSGYADVYFYAGRSAEGDKITVEVGSARCSTTL
jgi:hypothetical protein